jgi:hypothetical protein
MASKLSQLLLVEVVVVWANLKIRRSTSGHPTLKNHWLPFLPVGLLSSCFTGS